MRKLLGSRQLFDLETLRFAQLDAGLNVENGFATASAHVDVNRMVFVAVEEKPVTIFLENLRHGLVFSGQEEVGDDVEWGRAVAEDGELFVGIGNEARGEGA